MRSGKIIPNGVVLEKHEYKTVLFFTEKGLDVELIPRSNISGIHTPDIVMCGLKWEIKSPIGEGRFLISNTIQKATKQSPNVIIDLRRTKRHQAKCLKEIQREFERSKSLNNLKVITKTGKILDFVKK